MTEKNQWQHFPQLLKKLQLDDSGLNVDRQSDTMSAGGSLVVYHQGNCVVDTSVGHAQKGTPWTSDRLSLNFSTGKGVLATLVHCIASQGLLDYDVPIADYWREFGCHGKQGITLRQVMSHQADLFAIDSIIDDNQLMLNYSIMVDKIAQMSAQKPRGDFTDLNIHPQGYTVYSALVYGWILSAVIEKVTQMPLQQALKQYLAQPLGIVDSLFIGMPAEKTPLVAQPTRLFNDDNRLTKTSSTENTNRQNQSLSSSSSRHPRRKPILKPDSEHTLQVYSGLSCYQQWQQNLQQTYGIDKACLHTADINRLYFDLAIFNRANYKSALVANAKQDFDYYQSQVLQATIPAVNCVASASALAKIYAMLANQGRFNGRQVIDATTFAKLQQVQSYGIDAVMPATEPKSMHWRLGYHRVLSNCHQVVDGFGHIGYNGSMGWCDPSRQLAVAFVHNYDTTMLNDVRQFALTETVLAAADC